jgi:hypothetical protein
MPEWHGRLAAATMAAGLSTLLVAASSRNLTVQDLGAGRYRLSIELRTGAEPMENARAQLRLRQRAERLCSAQGGAAPVGGLELGEAVRGWLSLSEVYACRSAANR